MSTSKTIAKMGRLENADIERVTIMRGARQEKFLHMRGVD